MTVEQGYGCPIWSLVLRVWFSGWDRAGSSAGRGAPRLYRKGLPAHMLKSAAWTWIPDLTAARCETLAKRLPSELNGTRTEIEWGICTSL